MSVFTRWIAAPVVVFAMLASLQASGGMIQAVRAGDPAHVAALIRQKANVNETGADGATALHWAAQASNTQVMQLLLGAGAKANAANVYGVTPLALACLNASTGAVDALLRHGADPNLASVTAETPLMTAARTGNVGIVTRLVEARARVDAREAAGQTALMWAAAEAHTGVVRELIRAGADVNGTSSGKFTALMFAARSGDVASVRALLDAGARIADTAASGRDALIIAAASGHNPVVEFLLTKGASPNVTDGAGMTPLHAAVWGNVQNVEGIRLLLARGANPNVRTTGNVPQRAKYNYFADIYYRTPTFTTFTGATPMALAAIQADAVAMRALGAGGADVSIPLNNGSTPLALAAGLGWTVEQSPVTPEQAVEAVKAALDLGADINARNKGGRMALHGAANQGAVPVLQFLAARGADINGVDEHGWTALWTAEHAQLGASILVQPEAMKALRALGAKEIVPPKETALAPAVQAR